MNTRFAMILLVVLTICVAAFASPTDSAGADVSSHGGKIALWLDEHGIPAELTVIAIATLPIVELRGAIPVAMHVFKMPIVKSYLLCVLGNMIPIPFI